MRRILFVDSGGECTGAHNAFADMILAVKGGGLDEVAVVMPASPVSRRLSGAGVRVFEGCVSRGVRGFSWWARVRAFFAPNRVISRAIGEFVPHLVHANGIRAFGEAWLAAPRSIPVVWHVRQLRLRPSLVEAARGCAACLIPASPTLGRALMQVRRRGGAHTPCTVVPPCVVLDVPPLSRGEARARLGIGADAVVVGMVADLVPEKRHGLLIQEARLIARRVPNLVLLFIGRGDRRGHWRRQWKEALEGIEVRWVTDCDRASDWLGAYDVLVSPSSQEAFGRAVAEAMLAGVPVVARDAGGPGDFIQDGRTGLLVSARHRRPGDLAAAVLRLVEDRELAASVAKQARAAAVERFAPEKMARRLSETYEQILRHAVGVGGGDGADSDE